jgi:ribosomal-protein-alanine N-acetyltransferase
MKIHALRIRSGDGGIFKALSLGKKSIETRAATPVFRKVQVGDLVKFTYGDKILEKRVRRVRHFASVAELSSAGLMDRVAPHTLSAKDAESVTRSLFRDQAKIQQHGLLAFDLGDYVTIRTIERRDAQAVQALAKAHLEPWYGSQMQAVYDWLLGSNHRTAWVAELEGKIVGFAIISDKYERDYVKLSTIIVQPAMRNRGVGEHLLERCLAYASSTDRSRMLLLVSEDNVLTKTFFQRHGFQELGRIENKYRPGRAECVYERRLR